MEELAALVSLLVLFFVIWNFFDTLKMRRELTQNQELGSNCMPSLLQDEVIRQIEDGYQLVAVEQNKARLIKKKRYWFPFWIFFLMPNAINIILNSSFLCNIYGVELRLVGDEIEVSTF